MADFEDVAANRMLNAQAAVITAASVHVDNPGSTGANEASGGGYARVTPTFAAAAGRAVSVSGLVFTLGAGVRVSYIGLWAGSVWQGKLNVVGGFLTPAAGSYTISAATLTLA